MKYTGTISILPESAVALAHLQCFFLKLQHDFPLTLPRTNHSWFASLCLIPQLGLCPRMWGNHIVICIA
jgi:hypothetical protein